jgi:hypothetical protein
VRPFCREIARERAADDQHRGGRRQEDRSEPADKTKDELVQKKVVPKATYDTINDQIVAK